MPEPDYADILFGRPGQAPRSAPPPPPSQPDAAGPPDYAARLFPQQEVRSTTVAPAAGRVDTPDRAAPIGVIGNASLLPDIEDQITLYSRQMGIPRNQFGIDRDGQIIYADPQNGGAPTRVVPSVFGGGGGVGDYAARGARWLASQVGPSIPAAASAVGGMAGPLAGIPLAAGAGFVGDLARQSLGRFLGGMDQTGINIPNAAAQGALGGVGQAIGSGATSILSRNPLGVNAADRVAAQNRGNLALWQRNYQDAADQGIQLDVAQATGLPSLTAQGRQLRRFPETMDVMTRRLENQQLRQIPQAVERNIAGNVGGIRTVDDAVGMNPEFPPRDPAGNALPRPGMRGAAQDIIDQAEAARTAAASPGYQEAFASGVVPDITPTLTRLDDLIASGRFPENSATLRALQSARQSLTRQGQDAQGNPIRVATDNYEGMHNAKLAMDTALGELGRAGAGRSDLRVAERNLVEIQQELTNTLRQAHPGYDRGYQAYIAASPAVDEVTRDLGALARMNGSERIQILDGVFNRESGITPERVGRMRQAFLMNGRIDEWNGALATWMDNRLTSAVAPLQQPGEVPNVAHRLFSFFGDPRQQDIMRAALPADAARNLEAFWGVLDNARRFSNIGSTTATDAAAVVTPSGVGRAVQLAGRAVSPSTVLEMGNLVANAVNVARTPEARIQLARAFTDADALRELGRLRMLNPGSEQAIRIAGQFITNALGNNAGSALLPPTPRALPRPGAPTAGPQ